MTIGTLALLFIVPALFVTFQWLQERLRPATAKVMICFFIIYIVYFIRK